MPPKKNEESNKTKNKKKEKVVDDLTFGLKNKNKSKVVQQYVKEVTNKVMFSQVKVSTLHTTKPVSTLFNTLSDCLICQLAGWCTSS
jgi:hypothetical protein